MSAATIAEPKTKPIASVSTDQSPEIAPKGGTPTNAKGQRNFNRALITVRDIGIRKALRHHGKHYFKHEGEVLMHAVHSAPESQAVAEMKKQMHWDFIQTLAAIAGVTILLSRSLKFGGDFEFIENSMPLTEGEQQLLDKMNAQMAEEDAYNGNDDSIGMIGSGLGKPTMGKPVINRNMVPSRPGSGGAISEGNPDPLGSDWLPNNNPDNLDAADAFTDGGGTGGGTQSSGGGDQPKSE